MKATIKSIARSFFARSRRPYRGEALAEWERLTRSELFNDDQMELHGKVLATEHVLDGFSTKNQLLKRLDDNEQFLINTCTLLTKAIKDKRQITPAGEWLLDNFYLVEDQIRTARRHLPKGYCAELRRLAQGTSRGLPRVYDLALAAISHGDGLIELERLNRFVVAYQTVAPLTLGELWAIPIMLRLALIESLRRVAVRISTGIVHAERAIAWTNEMMRVAETDPKNLILVTADMARSNPPITGSFVAELSRRLQGHGPALALPLTWVEQHLAESSLTIERIIHAENQHQAADHVSIRNTISSLRFLGATDWRDFVESVSEVEQTLRQDAQQVYSRMNFATRDRYRHVIERVAKRANHTEVEIAGMAIRLALENAARPQSASTLRDAPLDGTNQAVAHVGYYLIGQGHQQLIAAANARYTFLERVRQWFAPHALSLYLGSMLLITICFSAVLVTQLSAGDVEEWRLVFIGLLAMMATSHFASVMINWLVTLMVAPDPLPRLDFSSGIPEQQRTLVVIPSLLIDTQGIESLLDALEVRFIGNQDPCLHFGLLTDFPDANAATMESDDNLLEHARAGIESLNKKYPSGRFFLFHRPRVWNPSEKVWMGVERKRGKLANLNALLRVGDDAHFSIIVGDRQALTGVRYVITLDSDTELPRGAGRELAGAMAHPLNRPQYDDNLRVCAGYCILQPRVNVSLTSQNRSRYARLFGGEPGIDPYTRCVSDVYQDLFGEGSFIGKGIYDIDAFEFALKNQLPDNRILSHDLLEGCYARSGLLSDVNLYETHPSRYEADMARQERWIRGDWQVARWILPRVPAADGTTVTNSLSALSRWKIADNLRRSLIPISMLLLFLSGWLVADNSWQWMLAVVSIFFLPPLLIGLVDALSPPRESHFKQHGIGVLSSIGRQLTQALFRIAGLPHEAASNMKAVAVSLWRMGFSHSRLLEWRATPTESTITKRNNPSIVSTYRYMWAAPALAIVMVLMSSMGQGVDATIWILASLWLFSPAFAWWLSLPVHRVEAILSDDQVRFLRVVARKTWGFFEYFVTAEENWLPPDNFQEVPDPVVAHRTSPTNIGIALLANLSASDFGYITRGAFLERTRNTFASLSRLQRYRGHFFNWYDTQTLQPLSPRYVSAVDSGNLAGHLLTLRAGLLDFANQTIASPNLYEALFDTVDVLAASANEQTPEPTLRSISRLRTLINEQRLKGPLRASEQLRTLRPILKQATSIVATLNISPDPAVWQWAVTLEQQCQAAIDELRLLLPCLDMDTPPAGLESPFDLDNIATLHDLQTRGTTALETLNIRLREPATPEVNAWLDELRSRLVASLETAAARIEIARELARQAADFGKMDYEFLYDRSRHLISIGYNLDEYRLDTSSYDLLASESRLGCFVAIAQSQIPQESWFALGRLLTSAGGAPTLASWSGSMFEYLMPMLVMPSYKNTLLDQTCQAAVARQIDYGNQRGLPWGISESGYNLVDAGLNYRYHAFGVPGLGLQRGLVEDLVIAPYASALALMVSPEAACANLQRLADIGLVGQFGFFEAIDYTPARLARSEASMIVRSFMAHHQGMVLLSLAWLLHAQPMQRRFASDPNLQSTLLLLQEKIPKTPVYPIRVAESVVAGAFSKPSGAEPQISVALDTRVPEVLLLGNGRYQVMLTNAGGGYSRWQDLAITRWREDSTCDNWGTFIYLRDLDTGEYWSTTHQPTLKQAETRETLFCEGRAEYRRRDHEIEAYSEIVVSPEDDVELRRLRITNHSTRSRTIEVTSYAEVVLAAAAADDTQPSFSNLFIQTEILRSRGAIISTRRPRSSADPTPWMLHLLAANGAPLSNCSFETDRMRFIGRGNTLVAPRVMLESGDLAGSEGSVLDPVAAIRNILRIESSASATIDLVSGAADSRGSCMHLVDKYQDRHVRDRAFELAATHGAVTLRQINASETDAQLYRKLAASVLYANASMRADASLLQQNRRGQSGLWGYAISGDLPIVLLKISATSHIGLARQLIQCHDYWRLKGLIVDLVIWNEEHAGYRHVLQEEIMGLISRGTGNLDRPGGIFVRYGSQISIEDRILLETVARAIISDRRGTLAEQVNRRSLAPASVERLVPTMVHAHQRARPPVAKAHLILANSLGGFAEDGSEYVITTSPGQVTPAPWVNVLANPEFGTVISESGLGYTFSENAREFRLTPWRDDSVGGIGGEAIYLRDEESGFFWSPTPLPARSRQPYLTRHGFGYSVFEHDEDGIHSSLWVFVSLHDAVKFSVLKVRNNSGHERRMSATGYVEWVLGDLRPKTNMHVITSMDRGSGALLAHNAYNTEFGGRYVFFDVDDASRTLTGDRTEFLGRNGHLGDPDAMKRTRLSGRLGAGLDPCGAMRVGFNLEDGQEREVIFRLGAGRDIDVVRALATRLRTPGSARTALDQVRSYWQRTLGAIQVDTPDPALNTLTNGWLVYQALACRLWARSGFYQSGGAFGFRDQLQDVMALVHTEPGLVREHLLRAAERQFPEGDVQHWWHPPSGRGVRTRCSDDYLWLPLATCRYVLTTGDRGVLDESVHFLEGRAISAEEESYYDQPGLSTEVASLYQHCVRAIEHGLTRFGEHGLPLMGSGDWNDGMNLVGIEGKGESVWLGFFLVEVLTNFTGLAHQYKDQAFADRCSDNAAQLKRNLDLHAWDGAWYRRAWFDDGTPLGSFNNDECKIDSIAQSWSILSGAGEPERSRQAMNSFDQYLVRRDKKLVQLLDPPFDKSDLEPGYIKGYVPGVRENGGQYTHAAVWAAMAFAKMGDSGRAYELLTLINPINHCRTDLDVATYKGEPYVAAADIYGVEPHVGRAGWTWYTGSAAWLYRLITESVLGIRREANRLYLMPSVPQDWKTYHLTYRFGSSHYSVTVTQATRTQATPHSRITLDGELQIEDYISLVDDHAEHTVSVCKVIDIRPSPDSNPYSLVTSCTSKGE